MLLTIDRSVFLPFSWYALVGLLIGGWPLFREAYESILERRMTMELSMGIAVLAAAYTGYFLVALWITFFVLLAEVLEGLTLERGRRAIRDLLELLPREVSVRRDGAMRTVQLADLTVGDTVIVLPGSRIPVDGRVSGGNSFVDESRITGESMPVEKMLGAAAYAGTFNQSGSLEIIAERVGDDTSYGQILTAVERAERSRAPVQRLADQLAGYIVYVALGFAAFEYWISGGDTTATISVIVVAGACGVAAGTPLAILGGIGRAARIGAIIKGGVHLETLGKLNMVVFDKTGTLTRGTPSVTQLMPQQGVSDTDLLAAVASAERYSEHSIGKAIVAEALRRGIAVAEPETFSYSPGSGIAARTAGADILAGNLNWMRTNGVAVPAQTADQTSAAVFVASNGRLLGTITVEDTVRAEAAEAIARLNRLNIRTVLLTGDTQAIAQRVAAQIGIADVVGELLPEDKLARIKRITSDGQVVAMVGDGINDAPALAAASVGVAMGSGVEVAREQADVVLLGNDLLGFVRTVELARRTRRIIWFNFAGTILVDLAGIAAAMAGLIGPVEASIIHTASELAFILNAARLLPHRFAPERSPQNRQQPQVFTSRNSAVEP
jgi:Cd2+/Zn2+-exporting ATPase/Cu+-exporting ATPase